MYRLYLDYCYSAILIVNWIYSDISRFPVFYFKFLIICVHFTAMLGARNKDFSAPTITSSQLSTRPIKFDLNMLNREGQGMVHIVINNEAFQKGGGGIAPY